MKRVKPAGGQVVKYDQLNIIYACFEYITILDAKIYLMLKCFPTERIAIWTEIQWKFW